MPYWKNLRHATNTWNYFEEDNNEELDDYHAIISSAGYIPFYQGKLFELEDDNNSDHWTGAVTSRCF